MKVIGALLFLLLAAVPVGAYEYVVSGCPVSSDVKLTFDFSSGNQTSVIYVGTNLEEKTAAPGLSTGSGVSNMIFLARSNSSGRVEVRTNTNSMVYSNISCVAAVSETGQSVSFLLGGVCAMAFALAVSSRI